jgi:hypothetical protein
MSAAALEREEQEMEEFIFSLADDATSVDLTRFELITVSSDEAWEKLYELRLLTTLKLPLSLRRIEEGAFANCLHLRDLNFASLTSLQSIGSHALCRCGSLSGELILPGSLEVIKGFAFGYCRSLTKLSLTSSLLRIEGYAIRNCSMLECTLDLPEHLEFLGEHAFDG